MRHHLGKGELQISYRRQTACSNPARASSACEPEPKLTARQRRHRNEKRTVTVQALATLLGSLAGHLLVYQLILFSFTTPKRKESFKGGSEETFRDAKTRCWKVLSLVLEWGFFLFIFWVLFCFKNCGLKTYFL